jgi:hypothetical protein
MHLSSSFHGPSLPFLLLPSFRRLRLSVWKWNLPSADNDSLTNKFHRSKLRPNFD